MSRTKLSETQIEAKLAGLDGWQLVDGKLQRQFVFANFVEAFGFMTKVALVAEALDHHPEWSNVYKTVTVSLTTHEADGLTELDFNLAQRMNELADM